MNIVFKSIVILIGFLPLIGCVGDFCSSKFISANAHNAAIGSKREVDADNVILSKDDITNRKYAVIGYISASCRNIYGGLVFLGGHPTKEMVNKKLKNKAAELGADTVILIKYDEKGTKYGKNVFNGSGQAIKFIN